MPINENWFKKNPKKAGSLHSVKKPGSFSSSPSGLNDFFHVILVSYHLVVRAVSPPLLWHNSCLNSIRKQDIFPYEAVSHQLRNSWISG